MSQSEVETEDENPKLKDLEYKDEYDGGEAVVVYLGFSLGDKFPNFQEFHNRFEEACKTNYVRFSRRDSRTIEAAKREVSNHIFKPELEYSHLRYSCFFSHNHNNKSKRTGKRKRQSSTQEVFAACPASIALRTTKDGKFLEIYNVENCHNHPVSEKEYNNFLPKYGPITDSAINTSVHQDSTEYDKYKADFEKRASASHTRRVREILKDVDDFLLYLQYTYGKQEDDTEKMETDKDIAKKLKTVTESESE